MCRITKLFFPAQIQILSLLGGMEKDARTEPAVRVVRGAEEGPRRGRGGRLLVPGPRRHRRRSGGRREDTRANGVEFNESQV